MHQFSSLAPKGVRRWSLRSIVAATVATASVVALSPDAGAVLTAEPLPPLPPSGSYIPVDPPAQLAGCDMFPADSVFHADIRNAPIDPDGADLLADWEAKDATADTEPRIPVNLYATGKRFGFPYNVATSSTPDKRMYNVVPGQFDNNVPITSPFLRQDTSDRHGLILDAGSCELHEYIAVQYAGIWIGPVFYGWTADNGAKFDLSSYNYHYRGSTLVSSTASGLPLLPFVLKVAEVQAGEITHPLRFSVPNLNTTVRWPAQRTDGNSNDPGELPIGMWLRLPADYPETGLSEEAKAIVRALKVHGMILDDTGGNENAFTISAERSQLWDTEKIDNGDPGAPSLASALAEVTDHLEGDADDIWEVIDATAMQVSTSTFQID
jgi:hypothetical protein